MSLRATSVGLHLERQRERARSAFIEVRGLEAVAQRQAEIDALPTVEWKGKTLRTLRCNGTSGKGPHDTNVPEDLLWALIDFRIYRCPYHCNDDPWQARELRTAGEVQGAMWE